MGTAGGTSGGSAGGARGAPGRQLETLCLVVDGLGSGPEWGAAMDRARRLPGVVRVFVSPPMETMYLAYDPAVTDAAHLRAALERAGERGRAPHAGRSRRDALRWPGDLE